MGQQSSLVAHWLFGAYVFLLVLARPGGRGDRRDRGDRGDRGDLGDLGDLGDPPGLPGLPCPGLAVSAAVKTCQSRTDPCFMHLISAKNNTTGL